MSRAFVTAIVVQLAFGCQVLLAQKQTQLIKGFCPVEAFENKELESGDPAERAPVPFSQWGRASNGTESQRSFYFTFKSKDNRIKYIESPEKFIPAFCGYCLVRLVDENKFELGTPSISRSVDGQVFWFSDLTAAEKFDACIADGSLKYLPVLNGRCVTCDAKGFHNVIGNPWYYEIEHGRLYLFPNQSTKNSFNQNRAAYKSYDLGNSGVCPVGSIQGKVEFSSIYGSKVYRFFSDENRSLFQEDPAKYIR